MEQYLGVKLIQAEPMNLGDYNTFRGWIIPEDEDPNQKGYKVVYQDGYVSWSPKEVFEEAYRRLDNLTFGLAIEAMKKGLKVARKGWNGKGMWIALSMPPESPLAAHNFWNEHSRRFAQEKGGSAEVLPTVIMKTADNKILMGWLASQTDMLAEDWEVVE